MNRLAALATPLLSALMLCCGPAQAAPLRNWSKVDQVLGRRGKDFPGGVHNAFPLMHPTWVLVR